MLISSKPELVVYRTIPDWAHSVRASRCRVIWEAFEDANLDLAFVTLGSQGDHDVSFKSGYEVARATFPGARYIVLTEEDFLMAPETDLVAFARTFDRTMVGVTYYTRYSARLDRLITHTHPNGGLMSGGWFVVLDVDKLDAQGIVPDFTHPQDACCGLSMQIEDHILLAGEDDFPAMHYSVGTHLFWSRAWENRAHYGEFDGTVIEKRQDEIITDYEDRWELPRGYAV